MLLNLGSGAAASDVSSLLLVLAAMLALAKVLGDLFERVGQAAVIGELLAGVLLGPSVFRLVDPHQPIIEAFAEIGVVILLFQIGLETDLKKLFNVGSAAAAVALVGVVVPFSLGYAASRALGLSPLADLVMGATLAATSVGITARVLSDLGRLQDPESQVVLGAAVIDDVIALIILAVVSDVVAGGAITVVGVARNTVTAFGFIAVAVLLGSRLLPPALRIVARYGKVASLPVMALTVAFVVAALADRLGSAMIIGAFTAGLLFAPTPQAHQIEEGIVRIGYFFVPLFFAHVGALVDARAFADPRVLLVGGILTVCAVLGKVVAGYAPCWFKGRKLVVGVGMVPRGEVGLIFATTGVALGVLDDKLFAACAMMVLATTFMAPILLKQLLSKREGAPRQDEPGSVSLVSRA
jgi:Kef-type K+ transport system membrane component KefB